MCFYQNSTSNSQKTVNEASGSLYLSCPEMSYLKPTENLKFPWPVYTLQLVSLICRDRWSPDSERESWVYFDT